MDCATPTWYFNYQPFEQRGLAVEFTHGRVSAVYTLWQPPGWHATNGLRLGVPDARLTGATRRLVPVVCSGYDARVADSGGGRARCTTSPGDALGIRAAARPRRTRAGDRARRRAGCRTAPARRRAPDTPVLTSRTLDALAGASVYVKAECFQRGGAFKFRGAYNKIASLPANERAHGVVAYSSGNHAQAVAIAAQLLGTRATIVMPEDAPAAKLEATRGYGAEIVTYDRFADNREEIGARLAAERGLALVKPYDDPLVMAGQGTVALELLVEVPEPRPARRRRSAAAA